METADDSLRRLEGVTGVNFLQLRDKYKKSGLEASVSAELKQRNVDIVFPPRLETTSQQPAEGTPAVESGFIICKECNGQGIVNYRYNHMTLSKNCEVCDCEGVIKKG